MRGNCSVCPLMEWHLLLANYFSRVDIAGYEDGFSSESFCFTDDNDDKDLYATIPSTSAATSTTNTTASTGNGSNDH
ncbi:hypothetical protein G6F35_008019 [Rhizopus arrhizus]|nr:hypothetical protein G6F35_008019 [Rhizopus arrhizus]